MNAKIFVLLLTCSLLASLHPALALAATEPSAAPAPTVTPTATNYFDLTVNFTKPADAAGVLIVAKTAYAPTAPPIDGTVYTANARMGVGDPTVSGCILYCEDVVADAAASGSVTVTGLKAGTKYYFVAYSYNGTVAGDINYNRTINATTATTANVPPEGMSHNQKWISTFGTSAECANCHGVHHTAQLLPRGLDQWNKCHFCHQAGGDATNKIDIGLHTTNGSVDCGTCHSLHSFRTEELYSTNNRTGVKAFNKSYIRANMSKYINTTDYPPPSGGGTLTALDNTVFQNKPAEYAFSSVDPVTSKYNGVCQSCHLNTAVNHYTQTGADSHRSGVDCAICHVHKQGDADKYNAFRPGHQAGGVYVDFDSAGSPDCTICHDASNGVMDGIHGDGTIAKCSLCHNGTPNRENEKLGDSITISGKSPAGDARYANGIAAAGTWATVKCLDCHTTLYHGITIAAVSSKHQLSSNSSRGYDCERCHSTNKANEQLATHMPADTVANCVALCHGRTAAAAVTTTIVAKTVIDNVTFLDPEPNLNNTKCEHCHAVKGDYTLHGMTDDNSIADGINNATAPNATTVVNHNNLGNSLGIAPTFTGKLTPASYGGLLATEYNCGQCHSANPDSLDASNNANISNLEAMQLHTAANGTGSGDCLTCHTFAAVSDEITAGKAGTVQYCENCHAVANGNGPTGEKMYQYDGVRHHKTANAQAGNCTYCHADPRPTNIDSAATGFAANADEQSSDAAANLGTYTTGWVSDYSVTYPVNTTTVSGGDLANDAAIPKQPGCRICHTNYGIDGAGTAHSVNVACTTGGNHGYNIAGYSGTAAERTTGLTVYRNDFNAGLSGATDSTDPNMSTPSRVVQTVLSGHRIPANDGTSMIKVYNYGACLSCHSVQVMHAAPIPGTDYPALTNSGNVATDVQKVPWDTLRYGPGRTVFNLLRGSSNNNQSWNDHRMQNQNGIQNMWNQNTADPRGKTYIRGQSGGTSWNFNSTLTHNTIDIPLGVYSNHEVLGTGTNGHQPYAAYFTAITMPTVDDITITRAEYTGSAVVVWATNTLGSAQTLSFTYSGGGCGTVAMAWSAANSRYEGTCNTPAGYAVGIDSVTVANTTTASPLDTRTRLVSDSSGPGIIVFSAATYSVSESGGSVTITAQRTGGATGAVSVSYATSNGTATAGQDYTASSGILSWAAGNNADKTFTIPIINDGDCTGNETVNLTLSSPTGGATIGSPGTAVLTITAAETPGTLQFSSATYSVSETGGTVIITATRTGGSQCAVSVNYATADGTATAGQDYTASSGTLNWAAGDTANKTFTIPITNDSDCTGNETVNLALSNPTVATLGTPNTAVLTITAEETPGTLQFNAATYSANEGNSGTATATITVSRTGGSDCAVSVNYATADGTATAGNDYTAASGTLNWAAGDAANKTFTVTISGDTTVEPDETVTLTLSNPTLATLGAQSTAVLTITNDDLAVTPLDTWVDYTSQAPGNNAGNSGTSLPSTISISAGTNRIMLVSVTFELSGANTMQANPIVRVNNNAGQQFTDISTTINNAQQHAWLGYINNAQIPATQPFRLYVQWDVSGTTTTVTSYHVKYGSYQYVNQATPVRDSIVNNGGTTDITFGTQLDYQNGDLSVVVGANGGTPATAVIDSHTGDPLNEIAAAANTTNHSSRVFESAVHTGTGNYVNTARVNFSGTTSLRSAVVGVTLQP